MNTKYNFKRIAEDQLDLNDYYLKKEKIPFAHIEWLHFIQKLKGIEPIVLEISNNGGKRIGYFAGGLLRFMGIKVLGSPFWGWMGQHIGFDLREDVNKAKLIDDLIDYSIKTLKVSYIQITDFNTEYADIEGCSHKLITGERYKTCYIDLTLDEAQLSKNLKSGYRTSIRKFAKDGGFIEEDYSDEFIEEHHKQLEQVFTKVGHKTPDYREKMHTLFNSPDFSKGADDKLGVYSIKAILPVEENGVVVNKNIASSYYIHNGYMAMFASNASYGAYLKSCPNQALTWHAMMAFKEAGIHYLDMGGSGDYKLNFSGGDWQPKPIIIYCSNWYAKFVILGAKRNYGKVSHIIGKIRNLFKGK
ncbi:MAG: hypothetical protein E7074_04000 [Bacteroidales bacterium]|jgi:hypothetical protein|nr:hypothetical protein [Bacteroidales bacterium]